MLDRLFTMIRKALLPLWNARLPGIRRDAERLEPGLSPQEAYTEGYRTAYWDAVVDMAETGLIQEPKHTPMPTSLTEQQLAAEDSIN